MSYILMLLLGVASGNSGILIKQRERFELVAKREGGYHLSCVTLVNQQLLSDRLVHSAYVYIPEPFYAKVSGLRAQVKERELSGKKISFFFPESEDLFITDLKVHKLDFTEAVKSGDKLGYTYKRNFLDPTFMPILTVSNLESVKSYEVIFVHPPEIEVQFEVVFPFGGIEHIITRESPTETKLSLFNSAGFETLANFPFSDHQAYILPKLLGPDGGYICNARPEEFNTWFGGFLKDVQAEKGTLHKIAEDLTKEAKTPREKLRALNDHVKTNIRYVADVAAMNAIVPRPPNVVIQRGYGDCKDRAFLLKSLAAELGLEVRPALISTKDQPEFESVRTHLFNHVICAYREGDDWLFFDPTQSYYPFGELPSVEMDKPVFLLGDGKPGEKARTPITTTGKLIEVKLEGDVAELGEGNATITLRGDLAAAARQALDQVDGLAVENVLSNMVTGLFRKISFDYFEYVAKTEDSLVFEAKADLNKFAIATGKKLYIPAEPFQVFESEMLSRDSDSQPFYFPGPMDIGFELRLKHDGFEAPAVEAGTWSLGTDDSARFSARVGQDTSVSVITYDLQLTGRRYEGDRKKALIAMVRQYLKNINKMLIFPRTQQP